MEILRLVLLFLHLVGFGSLFGGLFVQVKGSPRVVNNAILHGALTLLVTGLLLVGVLESLEPDVDRVKVGVKLAVALVVTVLVVANRRKPTLPRGLYLGLLLLTLLNAGVAVFWAPAHA
jgi:hypothetical protein